MFLTLRLMVFFLFFLLLLLLGGGGGGGLLFGRGRCLRRGRRRRPTFPQYSQSILESVCNIQREREREKVKRFEKQLRRRRPLRTV